MDTEKEFEFLQRAQAGDRDALGALVERYRDRLKLLVSVRIDSRVKQRLDESDVIQELYLRLNQDTALGEHASSEEYGIENTKNFDATKPTATTSLTAYLWLRRVAIWTLADLQRKHLGVQQRDPRRELSLARLCCSSSFDVATLFVSSSTQPLDAIIRDERMKALESLLDQLEPLDREIIMLRHGEQLTRSEAAALLNISIAAAAKRYLRALSKIRGMMKEWET